MTEAELLRTLDGDDHEALLVCADWLEGQGRNDAATLLRLEHRLRVQDRPTNLIELGIQVSKLARETPAPWLARIARTSPIGEWRGPDSDGEVWKFRYVDDGTLHYSNDSTMHPDGEWKQVGSLIVMSSNKKFTHYVGLIASDRIVGASRTKNDLEWTWEVEPAKGLQRPKLTTPRPTKPARPAKPAKPAKPAVAKSRTSTTKPQPGKKRPR